MIATSKYVDILFYSCLKILQLFKNFSEFINTNIHNVLYRYIRRMVYKSYVRDNHSLQPIQAPYLSISNFSK